MKRKLRQKRRSQRIPTDGIPMWALAKVEWRALLQSEDELTKLANDLYVYRKDLTQQLGRAWYKEKVIALATRIKNEEQREYAVGTKERQQELLQVIKRVEKL